jgi:hypothetical protein
MPAHSSVAKDMQGTAFRRLVTNGGEKCGLAAYLFFKSQGFNMRFQFRVKLQKDALNQIFIPA